MMTIQKRSKIGGFRTEHMGRQEIGSQNPRGSPEIRGWTLKNHEASTRRLD